MDEHAGCCIALIIAIFIILYLWYPQENAWFKKKPERMEVGNVFAGTTYGIQGRARGDFFVPMKVVPSNTPKITGWIVPGITDRRYPS